MIYKANKMDVRDFEKEKDPNSEDETIESYAWEVTERHRIRYEELENKSAFARF